MAVTAQPHCRLGIAPVVEVGARDSDWKARI
jgi:hypothetical protein